MIRNFITDKVTEIEHKALPNGVFHMVKRVDYLDGNKYEISKQGKFYITVEVSFKDGIRKVERQLQAYQIV